MEFRRLNCEHYYCMRTQQLPATQPSHPVDSSRTLADIVPAFDFDALFAHPSMGGKRYLIFAQS